MLSEIIDAITEQYKGDNEMIIECLLDLDKHYDNCLITDVIMEMGYCPICGEKMVMCDIHEHHTELDGDYWEYGQELVCPYCG